MGRYGLALATVFLGIGLALVVGCGGSGHSVDAPLPAYEKGGDWWAGYAGLQACLVEPNHIGWDYSGYLHAYGGMSHSGYTHGLTPNTRNCTYPYGGGPNNEWNNANASSYHTGGVNMCFVDGTVRFIGDSIDLNTYRALASRNLGEAISGDF